MVVLSEEIRVSLEYHMPTEEEFENEACSLPPL